MCMCVAGQREHWEEQGTRDEWKRLEGLKVTFKLSLEE